MWRDSSAASRRARYRRCSSRQSLASLEEFTSASSLSLSPLYSCTTMAPPVFYHMPLSPCSRSALLAARLLNVDVEVKLVDLLAGDHLKPEFLKLNPLHTIPTLEDNGFAVVDSHAIATYLADKYGKDDKYYPKELQKRSLVDQRLHFNNSILYKRIRDITYPVFFLGVDRIPEDLKAKVHEGLNWLEGYLKPTGWIAGDHITIADAVCVSSVTTYIAIGFNLSKYPHVQAWLTNCKKVIPDFDELDKKGADDLHVAFKAKLKPGEL